MKKLTHSDFIGHYNSYIYILTSQEFESKNILKIGYCCDIQRRVNQLNYEIPYEENKFYIVYSKYFEGCIIKRVEAAIHRLLKNFRHEWELYSGELDYFIHVICCLHDFIYLGVTHPLLKS